MGLDVIDEKKLQAAADAVLAAFLDRVVKEVIPNLSAVVDGAIDRLEKVAAIEIENVVAGAHQTAEEFAKDVAGLINSLDGWTLEIAPITIYLRKPQDKA